MYIYIYVYIHTRERRRGGCVPRARVRVCTRCVRTATWCGVTRCHVLSCNPMRATRAIGCDATQRDVMHARHVWTTHVYVKVVYDASRERERDGGIT